MAEPPTLSNDEILKKRAFGRLAIALVLIAAAILGLTLINRVSVEERPAPAVATAPPTPETPESAAQSTAPPPPEVSRVPDPGETPPPEPSVVPAPKAMPVPATPAPAPSQGLSTPAPLQSAKPTADVALAPQAAKPTSPILKLADAPIPPGKGYTVQMGVFNTYANADALLEKLKERGVPAYTETRVVVGPFRTRREAKKAAVTLKGLGEPVIITPPKRSGSR